MTRSVYVRVSGRVQGVSFRAYTAEQAERRDVTGWVRNEADGTVTAHFEGYDDAVAALLEWCRQGPPAARVDHVEITDATASDARSFEVR